MNGEQPVCFDWLKEADKPPEKVIIQTRLQKMWDWVLRRKVPYYRTWFKVTHTWIGSPIGVWDVRPFLPWMNKPIPLGMLVRLNPRIVQ